MLTGLGVSGLSSSFQAFTGLGSSVQAFTGLGFRVWGACHGAQRDFHLNTCTLKPQKLYA